MEKEFHVLTRDGSRVPVNTARIKERLQGLTSGLNTDYLDIDIVVAKVIKGIYDGVTTEILDNLSAETCAYMSIVHPDYSKLAARISVSSLHKNTEADYLKLSGILINFKDKAGRDAPLLNDRIYKVIVDNHEKIQAALNYERDFDYDFFGFKTLEKSYLLRIDGKIAERPQHMLMRVSLGIHYEDVDAAIETYNYMSTFWFTHATPTLFNSGTTRPQMSSCFLLTMKDDSIDGIYETLKNCAIISKSAGGIGLAIHNIRCKDSYIRGTNGQSNGIIPMIRVFNDTARYVDQGGGKRKGAFAIYLEPWHGDIYEFLHLKKNTGKEEQRARDLFFALWISDLFMRRVEANEDWTLMCPNECPGLSDCWGEEFEKLYISYEQKKMGRKTVKAQHLWAAIVESQTETGTPYMLYKDSANRKSNQQNLGTIKCSNLCTEILEYTSPEEVAVCNLGSISLGKFVKEDLTYDYEQLEKVARVLTVNLNKVIDLNYYPIPEAKYSNLKHRPIGIGVQGLADAFMKMRIPYESEKAMEVNGKIFETIYYAAMSSSNQLAIELGPYDSIKGSPIEKGLFQFDLWGKKASDRYDWETLRESIKKHGVRNSLTVAPMPTASTSQILGNNESFEPYTSNLYVRRVLSGEFIILNPHLVRELISLDLWNSKIKTQIMALNGSVQAIKEIPDDLKRVYKTVWEIPQKVIINLAVNRAPFIDQSQSLNIHLADANFARISAMHFYAWKVGLKTGMYYLRTKPAVDAIKFTLNMEELLKATESKNKEDVIKCLDNTIKVEEMKSEDGKKEKDAKNIAVEEEGCLSCSG